MMRSTLRRLACASVLIACPALAGQADICYGPEISNLLPSAPTNSTLFNCPQAGQKTLPQLAQEGWSVVQMLPVTLSGSTQAVQLVIQKP